MVPVSPWLLGRKQRGVWEWLPPQGRPKFSQNNFQAMSLSDFSQVFQTLWDWSQRAPQELKQQGNREVQ